MENFEVVQELKLELIHEYEKYVRTVASLTEASEEDAREAFHTAICRMLVGLQKRPPGNPIAAWRPYLIQAAVHELRESERRAKRLKKKILPFSQLDEKDRREFSGTTASQPTPLEQAAEKELARVAWGELAHLPERQREVVKRWCYDETFEEIAAALGIDPGTAQVHYYNGIGELRRRLRNAA